MTVEELMDQLKTLPPETPVLVEGYETGYDDIVDIRSVEVVRYRKAQEWDGEYQAGDAFSGKSSKTITALALLGRRGHLR